MVAWGGDVALGDADEIAICVAKHAGRMLEGDDALSAWID